LSDLDRSTLDATGIQTPQRLIGHITPNGNIGRELVDVDLPYAGRLEAKVLGQSAQDIARANFLFAPAKDLQGHHGWAQRLGRAFTRATNGALEVRQRMPDTLDALHLINLTDPTHLVQTRKTKHQTAFTCTTGAANPVSVHFNLGGNVNVNHGLETLNVQPASRHIGGNQNATAAVGELDQDLIAFTLLKIAMKFERDEALSTQHGNEVSTLLLGVTKSECCFGTKVIQQQPHRMQAFIIRHLIKALLNLICRMALR
jgi:hypothetical protein